VDITVTVKIGNVEVELTLEEAAELHAVLGRVCGKPAEVPLPYPVPAPYPVPYYERLWPDWRGVTWTANTSGITLTVSPRPGTIVGSGSAGTISWGQQ